jgi:hypothetical protein
MELTNVGLLNGADVKVLKNGLLLASTRFSPLNFVEVGINNGNTARAVAHALEGRDFTYTGIDNETDMKISPPFEGAALILGDSADVFSDEKLPKEIHFLLIDGCHCVNHVLLDFLHYGSRVAQGGLLFFHDTAPHWQGFQGDRQGHGPQLPEFCIGVLKALEKVSPILEKDWSLVAESFPSWGGARLYQRNLSPSLG